MFTEAENRVEARLAEVHAGERAGLDRAARLEFDEWFQLHEVTARLFAGGQIEQGLASWFNGVLGEGSPEQFNGLPLARRVVGVEVAQVLMAKAVNQARQAQGAVA